MKQHVHSNLKTRYMLKPSVKNIGHSFKVASIYSHKQDTQITKFNMFQDLAVFISVTQVHAQILKTNGHFPSSHTNKHFLTYFLVMKYFILLRFVIISSYEIFLVFAWCPTKVHGNCSLVLLMYLV